MPEKPVALDTHYVWFDNVRVEGRPDGLFCYVNGRRLPLPVVILHPDCKLSGNGDVGRLGVPAGWAIERGLVERESAHPKVGIKPRRGPIDLDDD
jgi:hypothetical protein